jgi:hypothetical protein
MELVEERRLSEDIRREEERIRHNIDATAINICFLDISSVCFPTFTITLA